MNDSIPTVTASDNAWMTSGDWEDRNSLVGNRVAFEALRHAIDQLLSGETATVTIDSEDLDITWIKLQEAQDPVQPTTLKEKILICSILALLVLTLLLGFGTLMAGVASLFS